MARYSKSADYTDSAFTVSALHMTNADTLVDADLWAQGIDPASVTLPQPLLTQLAVAYASAEAAHDKARGEDSTLLYKSDGYSKRAKAIAAKLTRQALGIAVSAPGEAGGGGPGSIRIRRG